MNKLIIKLNDSNGLQSSNEAVKLLKISSSISPLNFIKLLKQADNKVNPRIAKVNKITKSIHETLETSPELFWYKSKGILLATESCRMLDRNRVEITLDNKEYEGIMDGGHNTFAIATHIIDILFGIKIKTWDECKQFWSENYEEILGLFNERESDFKFSIPIEIITPNNEDGAIEQYYDYISEICSARNNNVQLTETSKGNQVGYYDFLKGLLEYKYDVIWKAGDHGKIKSEDIISISILPLIFLKEKGLLPSDLKSINKISIYSQKSKCVDFYNAVISNEAISEEIKGKFVLKNQLVKAALSLTEDIIIFFDRLYLEFPNLYHNASPGKFGRISSVDMKESRVPFMSINEKAEYSYSLGYIYPILAGLTSLMEVDETSNTVYWRSNPVEMDLNMLDLTQYVNIIKLVQFDPQKVGKGEVFYREAEVTFSKIPQSLSQKTLF